MTIRLTQARNVFRVRGTGATQRIVSSPVVQRMRVNSPSNIGADGPVGPAGPTGPAGPGVAAGGTTGQVLKKLSATDYDTDWQDEAGGLTDAPSDGTTYGRKDGAWVAVVGTVVSVNGQTGVVVLTTTDIAEGTNLYYTEARVAANTDVAANTAARHTHANQAVLDATTASFLLADEAKLDGIEAGAQVNTVASVNTQTGAVVLDTDDVAEGALNLYYTEARVAANTTVAANTAARVPAGGSTNYVLAKNSPTDHDMSWKIASSTHSHYADTILDYVDAVGTTDFGDAVALTTNVSLNTAHRASTSNPHNVLASQISDFNTTALLRAGNDYAGFPSGTPTGTSRLLYEKSFGYWKERCTFADLPVSTATQTALNGKLAIASNLSDVADQQTALNNVTAVAGATNEYVLTKDTGTGNAVWKVAAAGASAIGDLTDVVIATPADNEVLAYDNGSGNWINQTAAEAGLATAADLSAHTGASTGVHGVTGAVVGTTDTQTLSAKTLTTPTIADFTNATHDHSNAAGGGTIAHTDLTAVGTNTHAQIDTHLALVAEHIDWTNGGSHNFSHVGTFLSVGTGEHEWNHTVTGFDATAATGLLVDMNVNYDASSLQLGILSGMKLDMALVDGGSAATVAPIYLLEGRMDLGGMNIPNAPILFDITNPGSTQGYSNGAFRVSAVGGASSPSEQIACFTSITAHGTGIGMGYKGYATNGASDTGGLIGVQGSTFPGGTANCAFLVGLDALLLGGSGTANNKKMGLRTNYHALVRGNIFATPNSGVGVPADLSMTHIADDSDDGSIYAAGDTEVDGEAFFDGNISKAVTDVSSTPHTVLTTDTMVDATTTNHVENLPAISGLSGNREVVVKKVDASGNTVTVTPNGSDTIDGASSYVLSTQYEYVRLVAGNGTDWHVTGKG